MPPASTVIFSCFHCRHPVSRVTEFELLESAPPPHPRRLPTLTAPREEKLTAAGDDSLFCLPRVLGACAQPRGAPGAVTAHPDGDKATQLPPRLGKGSFPFIREMLVSRALPEGVVSELTPSPHAPWLPLTEAPLQGQRGLCDLTAQSPEMGTACTQRSSHVR